MTEKATPRGRKLADLVKPLDAPAPAPAPEPAPAERQGAPKLVQVNVFMTAEDHRRLSQLKVDTGLSLQKQILEGLDLMLARRGLPPMQPATAARASGRRSDS